MLNNELKPTLNLRTIYQTWYEESSQIYNSIMN